ncbi:MAG: tail fiber domain-containing protein, partial [Thermoanaerobaculia bacterium]|nr:tail fiber domain-containing protein [Thermoanaerobaculia bacterium]
QATERQLRSAGKLPSRPMVQSGSFSVEGGAIVDGSLTEATDGKAGGFVPTPKDQVIADDLIVQGSACVGQDCVNNESFGFDTIRLKENNTRIKFDDTSSSGSFPNVDWQLTANDSANGGSNKFSIEDVTNGRVPFTILATAPTNSVYVNASGNVGLGTASPVLDLHVVNGNSPAMRLEQDGSSGFTAQTWDIAGNEAVFFVRDVTNGSKLPFKIEPNTPTNTLYLDSTGNVGLGITAPANKLDISGGLSTTGDVGIGTTTPSATLHVVGSDGDTSLRIAENSTTTAVRTILDLRNTGDLQFVMRNTATGGDTWQFLNYADGFQISRPSTTNVFAFLETGDMQIPAGGSYTTASDRNLKENIEAVDPQQVLDKVLRLPIAVWNYKTQNAAMRHMGPMAQDFYALFGLGDSDTTISVTDPGAVALAAIQGLHKEVEERDSTIENLRQHNADLEARLARLEALLGQ